MVKYEFFGARGFGALGVAMRQQQGVQRSLGVKQQRRSEAEKKSAKSLRASLCALWTSPSSQALQPPPLLQHQRTDTASASHQPARPPASARLSASSPPRASDARAAATQDATDERQELAQQAADQHLITHRGACEWAASCASCPRGRGRWQSAASRPARTRGSSTHDRTCMHSWRRRLRGRRLWRLRTTRGLRHSHHTRARVIETLPRLRTAVWRSHGQHLTQNQHGMTLHNGELQPMTTRTRTDIVCVPAVVLLSRDEHSFDAMLRLDTLSICTSLPCKELYGITRSWWRVAVCALTWPLWL